MRGFDEKPSFRFVSFRAVAERGEIRGVPRTDLAPPGIVREQALLLPSRIFGGSQFTVAGAVISGGMDHLDS